VLTRNGRRQAEGLRKHKLTSFEGSKTPAAIEFRRKSQAPPPPPIALLYDAMLYHAMLCSSSLSRASLALVRSRTVRRSSQAVPLVAPDAVLAPLEAAPPGLEAALELAGGGGGRAASAAVRRMSMSFALPGEALQGKKPKKPSGGLDGAPSKGPAKPANARRTIGPAAASKAHGGGQNRRQSAAPRVAGRK
jgi:hypothetical protein